MCPQGSLSDYLTLTNARQLTFLMADFPAIFGGTASPTFESLRTTKYNFLVL
jgi:hypothetical protein